MIILTVLKFKYIQLDIIEQFKVLSATFTVYIHLGQDLECHMLRENIICHLIATRQILLSKTMHYQMDINLFKLIMMIKLF